MRTYERRPIGHSLEVHGANRHISKQLATPEKNAQRSHQGCQTQCAITVAKFEAGEFGIKTAGRWPARSTEQHTTSGKSGNGDGTPRQVSTRIAPGLLRVLRGDPVPGPDSRMALGVRLSVASQWLPKSRGDVGLSLPRGGAHAVRSTDWRRSRRPRPGVVRPALRQAELRSVHIHGLSSMTCW